MEDLQKKIEGLYHDLDIARGETDYYRGLAGTYRTANHRNLKKNKLLNKLLVVTVFLLVISVTFLLLILFA